MGLVGSVGPPIGLSGEATLSQRPFHTRGIQHETRGRDRHRPSLALFRG
jgi:hypothetical protein